MQQLNNHQSARGRVKIQVIENGSLVRDIPWQKNLILDQGLDFVAARTWAACMTHCAAGTGTTPTRDDSGAVTASQSGTTVTASAGFFAVGDVGKLLKYDSGAEARITGYTSTTVVTVGTSATVATSLFTLYRVNQIGLASESKRTSTYLTGTGNCGYTDGGTPGVTALTRTLKRTFDFTAEVGNVNYSEIGISWTASVGNNLFSRILFEGGAVTVLTGQQLRIVYELEVTLSPSITAVSRTAAITGWAASDGTELIQSLSLSYMDTLGVTQTFGGAALEPSQQTFAFLSTVSTALAAPGSSVSRATTSFNNKTLVPSSYAAGSFTLDKSATFAVGEANRNDWRSMGIGPNDGGAGTSAATNNALVLLFSGPNEKLNTHTLAVTWRFTWGRTL